MTPRERPARHVARSRNRPGSSGRGVGRRSRLGQEGVDQFAEGARSCRGRRRGSARWPTGPPGGGGVPRRPGRRPGSAPGWRPPPAAVSRRGCGWRRPTFTSACGGVDVDARFVGHDLGLDVGRGEVELDGHEPLPGRVLQVLEDALVAGVVGDHQLEPRRGVERDARAGRPAAGGGGRSAGG